MVSSRVRQWRFPILLLVALSVVAGAIAYAGTSERSSTWRDRDITIDGSDEDWRGQELPVQKQHFSLGIANDGEWLYLCLPTKDVGTKAQLGGAGLVVWLDPAGGKKRKFGLHFPVPNPPGQPGMRRRPAPESGEGSQAPPPEGEAPPVRGQDVIGVLGPGRNDAQLVPINEAGGIEARVGVHGDLMVYQLRLPLRRSPEHPYAPEIQPGQSVRLEIETAPLRGGMFPPGPYGIGGAMAQPWGRGWGITIGGAGRTVAVVPIDVTMNVHLARGPQ